VRRPASKKAQSKAQFQKQKFMDCEFSNPVDFQGNVPSSSTRSWNFKILTCSSTTSTLPVYISEIISTSTPEKNFYLSKTIDLGQMLIIGFIILFLLFGAVLSIKNLFFKKD
jgi:hypothetical protein